MDKTTEAIDRVIDYVADRLRCVPIVHMVTVAFEAQYPSMVDSVTTGMIETRIKEFGNGR